MAEVQEHDEQGEKDLPDDIIIYPSAQFKSEHWVLRAAKTDQRTKSTVNKFSEMFDMTFESKVEANTQPNRDKFANQLLQHVWKPKKRTKRKAQVPAAGPTDTSDPTDTSGSDPKQQKTLAGDIDLRCRNGGNDTRNRQGARIIQENREKRNAR